MGLFDAILSQLEGVFFEVDKGSLHEFTCQNQALEDTSRGNKEGVLEVILDVAFVLLSNVLADLRKLPIVGIDLTPKQILFFLECL